MASSRSSLLPAVNDANTQYRLLNHQIRVAEANLALAQRRRRWSNITLALGPFLLVVLFELYWVLRGRKSSEVL
jgi:hypothetical protein